MRHPKTRSTKPCSCEACSCGHYLSRAAFLDDVIDDVVPEGPVWFRVPGHTDLAFAYLPDRMSDPSHTR